MYIYSVSKKVHNCKSGHYHVSVYIASYQGDMCKFLSNSITPLRFLRIKCTLGISEDPLLPRIRHGPGTWKVSKKTW